MGGRGAYGRNTKGGVMLGGGGGGESESLNTAGYQHLYDGNKADTLSTAQFVEGKNNGLGYEIGVLIDEDGFVLLANKGDKHSVGFSNSQLATFKGKTLTHNHPNKEYGGTFSPADINVMTSTGLKEMRASAREGTYSLKATSRANPSGLANALSKALPTLENKMSTKTTRKAQVDILSNWYKRNASKYGYTYTISK